MCQVETTSWGSRRPAIFLGSLWYRRLWINDLLHLLKRQVLGQFDILFFQIGENDLNILSNHKLLQAMLRIQDECLTQGVQHVCFGTLFPRHNRLYNQLLRHFNVMLPAIWTNELVSRDSNCTRDECTSAVSKGERLCQEHCKCSQVLLLKALFRATQTALFRATQYLERLYTPHERRSNLIKKIQMLSRKHLLSGYSGCVWAILECYIEGGYSGH